MTIENRIVWAEIPAADMDRAMAFYSAVLGTALTKEDAGPNPIAMLPDARGKGTSGHVYPGTPAPSGTGPTVHLAVDFPLEEAMARIRDAGGNVVSDVVTIPAGSFFYATDTEGNSVGLFKV